MPDKGMEDSGNVPVPDPTKLTTDAVNAATDQWRRELDGLREIIETRLGGIDRATELAAVELVKLTNQLRDEMERALVSERRVFETRLSAMDQATKLLATNVDKVPFSIVEAAGNLERYILSRIDEVSNVSDEKFAAIDGIFASNALALTAALAAQKEAAAETNKSGTLAILKSEQATKETIGANAAQTVAGMSAQAAAHQDLKERVVRLEAGGVGRTQAVSEAKIDQRAAAGSSMAILMAVMTATAILIALGSLIFAVTR